MNMRLARMLTITTIFCGVLVLAIVILADDIQPPDPAVHTMFVKVMDRCVALSAEVDKILPDAEAGVAETPAGKERKAEALRILHEIKDSTLQAVVTLKQMEEAQRFKNLKELRPGLMPFIFMIQNADGYLEQFRDDEPPAEAPKTIDPEKS